VALIPTTIGDCGGIGMDRVAQFNVIATSGRAVEACGDVNTLVLDKTSTITLGNRLAEEFIPSTVTQEMLPRSLWLQVCLMKHQRESQLSVWQKIGATGHV